MRVPAAVIALPLVFAAIYAHAHAVLDHAEPRVGSTVSSAPRQLSLWFTQNLELASSAVEVRDASGARADTGRARVDPGNRSLLLVPLKALRAGTYHVRWRVLSVDAHTSEGSLSFHVGGR